MQTFLPYPGFTETALVLDRQRLGKQRVEAWQLLEVLTKGKRGWHNHPAAKMWAGYEFQLCNYGLAICTEWRMRGYRDQMHERFNDAIRDLPYSALPPWIGDDAFHAAHRSNLLRKDPVWYAQFGWTETPDLPYVWGLVSPVQAA